MKKKLLAAVMAAAMLLTGCSGNTSSGSSAANDASSTADNAASVKAGFVYIGKIDDGGYTQAHDQGRLAIEKMGVETAYVEDVAETVSDTCEAIRTLIDEGCNLIYTNSFGFMEGTVEWLRSTRTLSSLTAPATREATTFPPTSARFTSSLPRRHRCRHEDREELHRLRCC